MGNILQFIQKRKIHNFIQGMCEDELNTMLSNKKQILSWSSLSYCSNKGICTMNVAMPDFSAEYWVCYIPKNVSPIFAVKFPSWSLYTAITLYDSYGIPFSSVNNVEIKVDNKKVFKNLDRSYIIDFSDDIKTNDILVAVFRVYRPANVTITPANELPLLYFVDRNKPVLHFDNLVKQSSRKYATERGKEVGKKFNMFIEKYLKSIDNSRIGTQFFYPKIMTGLFPNTNATYVSAFLPNDKTCMIINGKVPKKQVWRPYYSIMTTEYSTTKTISSMTFEELGNWNNKFELYISRTKEEAIRCGYNQDNKHHKLLLWKKAKGLLCVVTRYIHYKSYKNAEKEINDLKTLDGSKIDMNIQGIGTINYV
jgi:hypothetical protein